MAITTKATRIWVIGGLAILVCISAVFVIKRNFLPVAGSDIRSPAPLPSGAAPEIVSARILPDRPHADTDLSVEYQARVPENAIVLYKFRWYVDGGIIQEGSDSTLAAGSFRKGESVSVEIIPSSMTGQGMPFKTEPVRIANLPPSVTSISTEPFQPAPGAEIVAVATGEDADREEVSFRYQWTVNGELVSGLPAESNRFSTKGLRKKDDICVTVTPWDGESAGKSVLSEIITLGNSAPRITSNPPTSLNNGVYSYQVSASDADGDKLIYSLDRAPEGMTIDAASGLIRWQPSKQVSEPQEIQVKIKALDGDGGAVSQEYSLFLEMQ